MGDFRLIYAPVQSLARRKDRLHLDRLSVKSDLLKQRASVREIVFDQFMEADFCLMLFSLLNFPDRRPWYPSSLVYAGYLQAFDLFLRGSSHSFFVKLAKLFKVNDKLDLSNRFREAAKHYNIGNWTDLTFYADVSFESLMNLGQLDTRP